MAVWSCYLMWQIFLQSFFAILMEYCLELVEVPSIESFTAINGLARCVYVCVCVCVCHKWSIALRSLFKLAHIDSLHSAVVLRRHLDHLRDHTFPHQYPSYATVSPSPLSLSQLIGLIVLQLLTFKIIATLFPTSDHRHPVTTPTMLIMASLLRKVVPSPLACGWGQFHALHLAVLCEDYGGCV